MDPSGRPKVAQFFNPNNVVKSVAAVADKKDTNACILPFNQLSLGISPQC
jgi:hypothetical protein